MRLSHKISQVFLSMWKTKEGTEDDGRWKEEVNELTGESSIKLHEPKMVAMFCKPIDHNYQLDGRHAVCTICGQERSFIPGLHELKGGKIVNI